MVKFKGVGLLDDIEVLDLLSEKDIKDSRTVNKVDPWLPKDQVQLWH